ncbi:DoxX family membrane protein [Tsukamurella strandjordii]|uniref:DoxX family membrane protein n=1 Tax=Tsukamurella strandjordii TaxID=147577 RepID=UPI0031D3824C
MIRRIARPLLGSYFIYSGVNTLLRPAETADSSAGVVHKAQEAFPDAPLPASPTTWARALGGAQLGGGTLLALGRLPRLSALTLAGTLAATTATENRFWAESDPAARQEATVHFLKNLSLIGGLIIAGFDTEGEPGVLWRTKRAGRHAADRASATVAALTPGTAEAGPDLGDRAAEVREKAHDAVATLADAASTRAARISAAASETLTDLREHAPEYADQVKDGAQRLVASAQERAPRYVDQVREAAEAAQDEIASRRRRG